MQMSDSVFALQWLSIVHICFNTNTERGLFDIIGIAVVCSLFPEQDKKIDISFIFEHAALTGSRGLTGSSEVEGK